MGLRDKVKPGRMDPGGVGGVEGPVTAKGLEVRGGARGSKDQGGAGGTRDPGSPR